MSLDITFLKVKRKGSLEKQPVFKRTQRIGLQILDQLLRRTFPHCFAIMIEVRAVRSR